MINYIKIIRIIGVFLIGIIINSPAIAQCIIPVITQITNSGPVCEGGTLTLNASGTVGGVSSSFIRMAGIGANAGNQEMNEVFTSGDRSGSMTRMSNAQFATIFAGSVTNAQKAAAIKAQYDVLLFTWASPQDPNLTWGLINAYLAIGGSVFWEDDSNIGRLNDGTPASVAGYATGGSYGCGYVLVNPAPFPALVANGINSCFANHHLAVSSWPAWMQVYIKGGAGENLAIAGVHPTGGGRLIIQGPDQDYHAVHHGSGAGGNQYQILLNQIDFLTAEQTGISWTGPNGFISNEKSPIITNVTAAMAGIYTAKLTNVSGGGCFTTATTNVVINTASIPTVSASGSTNLCPGSTVALTASSGGSYLWSNGATTQTITVNSSGNYTVSVAGTNGCLGTSLPTLVTVDNSYCNSAPIAIAKSLIISANADCEGIATASDFDNGSSDADGDQITFSVSPNGPYGKGLTNVVLTVTDSKGASSSSNASVSVVDSEKPTITAPNDVAVNTDNGSCEATNVFLGNAIKDDNCSGVIATNDAPASFPKGATTVTWTATDAAGNTATATQLVTVVDTEDPTITAPALVTVVTDNGSCEATGVVLGNAIANDNCSGVIVTNDAPASFPKGSTIVTWTATDAAGNTKTAMQTIAVTDGENPTISAPASVTVSTDATSCSATNVTIGSATAGDNCPNVTVTNDAPASFPKGATTVTWTATDASGNTAIATQLITVVDEVAPIVQTKNIIVTLANGVASINSASVDNGSTDNCGVVNLSISKSSFSCSEIGENTVTLTATDPKGNSSTGSAVVTVLGGIPNPQVSSMVLNPGPINSGNNSTIFLGHGSQQIMLAASNTVGTNTTYSWSMPTRLDDATSATPIFIPTSEGKYTFMVTATNEFGCSATNSITITVYDAVCGNKGDKVMVCHKGKEICVAPSAVQALMAQPNTFMGSCNPDLTQITTKVADPDGAKGSLKAYPNPFTATSSIEYTLATDGNYRAELVDMKGQLVKVIAEEGGVAGKTYSKEITSANLASGMYMVRLVSASEVKYLKLMLDK